MYLWFDIIVEFNWMCSMCMRWICIFFLLAESRTCVCALKMCLRIGCSVESNAMSIHYCTIAEDAYIFNTEGELNIVDCRYIYCIPAYSIHIHMYLRSRINWNQCAHVEYESFNHIAESYSIECVSYIQRRFWVECACVWRENLRHRIGYSVESNAMSTYHCIKMKDSYTFTQTETEYSFRGVHIY